MLNVCPPISQPVAANIASGDGIMMVWLLITMQTPFSMRGGREPLPPLETNMVRFL